MASQPSTEDESSQDPASLSVQNHERRSRIQTILPRVGAFRRNLFAFRRRAPLSTFSSIIKTPVGVVDEKEKLQVSVLVTMPSARRKVSVPEVPDADVPDVVFGVAEVSYRFEQH